MVGLATALEINECWHALGNEDVLLRPRPALDVEVLEEAVDPLSLLYPRIGRSPYVTSMAVRHTPAAVIQEGRT